MSSLYVIWQDPQPQSRMWIPVAKLEHKDNLFILSYTKGANHKNFSGLPRMQSKDKTYVSEDIFPFLSNRILSSRRPEYHSMLEWTDMNNDDFDLFRFLGVTSGSKKTDNFRVILAPERNGSDIYSFNFFVSGHRYMEPVQDESLMLTPGEKIDYEFERTNSHDSLAVALFHGGRKIGYFPKYLNEDIWVLTDILNSERKPLPKIKTIKFNADAPEQYKILCEFKSVWPESFKPFSSQDYQPIVSS